MQLEVVREVLEKTHSNLLGSDVAKNYLASRKVLSTPLVESMFLGFVGDSGLSQSVSWLKGVSPNVIIFPLVTPHFGYSGFLYRSVGDNPRVCGHRQSPELDGYPRFFTSLESLKAIYLSRSVVLVEGPFDCLAMSLAFPNVLCVSTSECSKAQYTYLRGLVDVMICAFDMDEAGESGWKKLKEASSGHELFRLKMAYKDPSKALEALGETRFVETVKQLVEPLLINV